MSQQDYLNAIAAKQRKLEQLIVNTQAEYKALRKAMEAVPPSITQQIDSIPGRRLFFNFVGTLPFTNSDNGQRGNPISFLISQDGPFVMTHYPVVAWAPSAPATATNFGIWRPVYTWPLPDQVTDGDRIDISWEVVSGGSQRNFQNQPVPPLFSRADVASPLPVPTIFNPNEVIQFFPTFNDILFDSQAATPTTGGTLTVALPGYRIVNM